MYNRDSQDKYCFPYYKNWPKNNKLVDNLNNLPMFFITNDEGVNFLIEIFKLKYWKQDSDCWHMIRNCETYNEEGYRFHYMFSDGYEPEDNNLCREWLFLCSILEELYKEGYQKGKTECNNE